MLVRVTPETVTQVKGLADKDILLLVDKVGGRVEVELPKTDYTKDVIADMMECLWQIFIRRAGVSNSGDDGQA